MNRKQRRLAAKKAGTPAGAAPAPAVGEVFDLALASHRAGRLDEAGRLYRKFLRRRPDHPEALHLLGVVAHQTGDHAAAIDLIGKAIAIDGAVAGYHNNIGEACRALGRIDEAFAHYRRAAELDPGFADAHHNLGVAALARGEAGEAVGHLQRALALEPALAEAHFCLGNALREQGQLDEAIAAYRRAVVAEPGLAEAHDSLGNAFLDRGELDEAVACTRKAIALEPDLAGAHNNLGNALVEQGVLDEAVACFNTAIALEPGFAWAHYNLGKALDKQDKLDDAVTSYGTAIALRPDFVEACNNLGVALDNLRRFDEAIVSYREAIALKPDYAEAHNNLAVALKNLGRVDEAAACFRRAIEIKPDYFEAYYDHALVHRFRPGDPEIDKLKELVARGDPSNDQRTKLLFALGKAHDDIGRYDEAFSYYAPANADMAGRADFDPSRHRKAILEIKEMFREPRGGADRDAGDGAPVPVFVVGMSRSGKTSVESLLTQHASVHGAGESMEWRNALMAVLDEYSLSTSLPEGMGLLSEEQIREIGEIYMGKIMKNSPGSRLFVNTVPDNDLYIGTILQALPMAEILYCRRDAMDLCLLVYFSRYKTGNDYSYDLSHLASYYADHHDMMAHWQRLYGERILSVRYEDLVRDPAGQAARIYQFCGLDDDPGKVSQAFTTDEIGHWKHYEPYLEELRQALGGLAG